MKIILWATNLMPGPATATDEHEQELSFRVSNDRNDLFLHQPSIDASGNLTFTPKPNAFGSALVSVVLLDGAEGFQALTAPSSSHTLTITINKLHLWHNALQRLDVTGRSGQPDGVVLAGDALAIINYINAFGSGPLPAGTAPGAPYLDTTGGLNGTGDNRVTAFDALAVINYINAFGSGLPGPTSDGESSSSSGDLPPVVSEDLISLLAIDNSKHMARRPKAGAKSTSARL